MRKVEQHLLEDSPQSDDDEDEEEGDGDLGGGSGDASTLLKLSAGDEDAEPRHRESVASSFVDDVPKKPSKWIRSFQTTQESAGAYAPHQWPKYHKRLVHFTHLIS